MSFSSHVKDTLLLEIKRLDLERGNFSEHPGIDFSRNRKLDFKTLLHFQISMESGSVNHELLKYFGYHKDSPTLSAFYQQRDKFSSKVFQELFYRFNSHYSPVRYKENTGFLPAMVPRLPLPEIRTMRIPIMILTSDWSMALTRSI